MSIYLLYACSIIISSIVLVGWYDLFFERKADYKEMIKRIVLLIGIFIPIRFVLNTFTDLDEFYLSLYGGIIEAFFEWFLLIRQYRGSTWQKAGVYVLCTIVIPVIEIFAFSRVNQGIIQAGARNVYFAEINTFTIQIITYVVIIIISEVKRKRKYGTQSYYFIPFAFIMSFQFGLHYIFENVFIARVNSDNQNLYLLAYGCSVVIFFCICIIYRKYISDMDYRRLNKNQMDYVKLQSGYYHEAKESLQEMRKIKHDFNKHMIVLRSLALEDKKEVLDQYIGRMDTQLTLSTTIIDARNPVISAQLTHINEVCRKNEIAFAYQLEYREIAMEPFDLNTILGNVLDNAVEASLNITAKPIRSIQISIQELKGMVMIMCKNNYHGQLQEKSGHLLTSKEDKKRHGFGIQNVQETVKKYSGKVEIQTQNQVFCISIIFKNKIAPLT